MYHKFLRMSTYIYLKAYPELSFSYVELGKILGMNRKTVAKEWEEIKDTINTDKDFNIKNFYLDEDLNKYQRAIKILQDLYPQKEFTLTQCAKLLEVSKATLTNHDVVLKKGGSNNG